MTIFFQSIECLGLHIARLRSPAPVSFWDIVIICIHFTHLLPNYPFHWPITTLNSLQSHLLACPTNSITRRCFILVSHHCLSQLIYSQCKYIYSVYPSHSQSNAPLKITFEGTHMNQAIDPNQFCTALRIIPVCLSTAKSETQNFTYSKPRTMPIEFMVSKYH